MAHFMREAQDSLWPCLNTNKLINRADSGLQNAELDIQMPWLQASLPYLHSWNLTKATSKLAPNGWSLDTEIANGLISAGLSTGKGCAAPLAWSRDFILSQPMSPKCILQRPRNWQAGKQGMSWGRKDTLLCSPFGWGHLPTGHMKLKTWTCDPEGSKQWYTQIFHQPRSLEKAVSRWVLSPASSWETSRRLSPALNHMDHLTHTQHLVTLTHGYPGAIDLGCELAKLQLPLILHGWPGLYHCPAPP